MIEDYQQEVPKKRHTNAVPLESTNKQKICQLD